MADTATMELTISLPDKYEQSRLSDVVYETLLEAILAGRLPSGTVVSEVSLAKTLDVSRTPVHDALRQLSKDGLIDQEANRRAVVATVSHNYVYEIFDMRMLLEGESAHRAASRLDRPTLAKLRATTEELGADRERPDWVAKWTDHDEEFHDAVAHASGSKRLTQDIGRYRLLHRGFNKLTTTVDVLQQALGEHVLILDALEDRDGERARSAMVAHIREWQAYFVSHFPRA